MKIHLKILVVEDLKLAEQVAENILRTIGRQVVVKNSGAIALNYIITNSVDLVLLDLDLPGMSGFEVCQTIRGLERVKHKIIIALTADDSEDLPEKSRRYRFDDYIIKPLTCESARYMTGEIFFFVS
jgi:CheY-like chemotaxis protein